MASVRTSQIYVSLLNEGTDVWRPVTAEQLRDDVYRIIGEAPDSDDEEWEFAPGDIVRCRKQKLSGNDCLVAYEAAV